MKKANRRDVLTILFLCLAVACLMTACMNSTGDNQNATAFSFRDDLAQPGGQRDARRL